MQKNGSTPLPEDGASPLRLMVLALVNILITLLWMILSARSKRDQT
jgi:hypothetical protein